MEATTIHPLGSRVLLKEKERETTTASGIVLPDTADYKDEIIEAEVLRVGAAADQVKAGDRVLAKKYLAEPVTVDGQKLLVIAEEDIIGIISTL